VGLGGLGCRCGLDGWRGRDGRAEQLPRQVRDALEVESIEDLEGEDDLVELDLPVGALEDAGAAGDGEVGLLVSQVRALHADVAVVAEVHAVDGLVAVTVALRHVLDEDADPRRDPDPLVQASVVHLQQAGKSNEVARGKDRQVGE
jgi:hypothetical protein